MAAVVSMLVPTERLGTQEISLLEFFTLPGWNHYILNS
jgi:hypothetical protein